MYKCALLYSFLLDHIGPTLHFHTFRFYLDNIAAQLFSYLNLIIDDLIFTIFHG